MENRKEHTSRDPNETAALDTCVCMCVSGSVCLCLRALMYSVYYVCKIITTDCYYKEYYESSATLYTVHSTQYISCVLEHSFSKAAYTLA